MEEQFEEDFAGRILEKIMPKDINTDEKIKQILE